MKNKISAVVVAAILIAALYSSCKNTGQKIGSGEPVSVSVRQEWFPNANFAGELVAMNETAKKNGIILKVEAGSDNIDPIKLVIGGNNDFGVVGAVAAVASRRDQQALRARSSTGRAMDS